MDDRIVTMRASSVGTLLDCAYKWEGEHLLGMRRPSSLRAHLGTAIHAGTAAFDQARVEGKPIRPDDAAGVFVDALTNPDEEVDFRSDKTIKLTDAEVIGLALTAKYCVEISPQFEFKSVEMKLSPLDIDCGDGLTMRLTGTMDRARVAHAEGGVVIPDIKTGGRIVSNGEVVLKGKSAQLGTYQLMYEHTTGEPTVGGQIIGLQTTKSAEVAVSRVFDAKRVMLGPPGEKGLIEYAAIMFKTGFFPPNPMSSLCSEKFCARWNHCIYHEQS
jgi:hypothetical protein